MRGAIQRMTSLGGQLVSDFDFGPFSTTAALLYGAPFVAERYAGIAAFLQRGAQPQPGQVVDILSDDRLLPVIRAIISNAARYCAVDVFDGMAHLVQLQVCVCACSQMCLHMFAQAAARQELKKIDVLMVPTAAYNYTLQEIAQEESDATCTTMPARNANLGRFTNFCNLLNLCGVSVWSGVMRVKQGTCGSKGQPSPIHSQRDHGQGPWSRREGAPTLRCPLG